MSQTLSYGQPALGINALIRILVLITTRKFSNYNENLYC